MLLSVIIPCYNVEAYISECLESVCTQELRELEVICIDDGSTDRTGEILEQWREKDDRIRLFRQENLGISKARNAGLRAAQGEYVYFLDGDDRIASPDVLQGCCDAMRQNDLDVLVGAARMFYDVPELREKFPQEKQTYYSIGHVYEGVLTGPESIKRLQQNSDWCAPVYTKLYRRAFLMDQEIFFLPGQVVHEDEYFALCSVFLAKRVMITQAALCDRRIRESSTVRTKRSLESTKGNLINYIEGLRFLEKHRDTCELDPDIGLTIAVGKKNSVIKYAALAEEEKARLWESMSPDQAFYLKTFIQPEAQKTQQIAEQKKSIADLKKKNAAAVQDAVKLNEQMKAKEKENAALEEQLSRLRKQAEAAEKREKQAKTRLQAIQESRSYRLGRLLSWPWRKLKQLLGR